MYRVLIFYRTMDGEDALLTDPTPRVDAERLLIALGQGFRIEGHHAVRARLVGPVRPCPSHVEGSICGRQA